MPELGKPGRRIFVRGMAQSIAETIDRVDQEERVDLLMIVLDHVMPTDEAEIAACFELLAARDKERKAAEPELPL